MLIHDQLESFLIGGRRVDPAEQWEIRRNCWDEHNEIVAALKSGKPKACRAAMVAHTRTTSQYRARLMPPSDSGGNGNGKAGGSTEVAGAHHEMHDGILIEISTAFSLMRWFPSFSLGGQSCCIVAGLHVSP